MAAAIDLNADVGEGFGDDEALVSVVTSVNVACGFHAGDPVLMDRTVALAAARGLALGAHPGYLDPSGFGRREWAVEPARVEAEVLYQVGALTAIARSHGVRVTHVKPHGALYNQAARDVALAEAVARGVRRADPSLVLVGLAASVPMRRAAEKEGLRFAGEAFADRAYEADGSLRPRSHEGAVLSDPEAAARQAVGIACRSSARALDGSEVPVEAETLSLHGDTPGALEIARAVRRAIEAAGVVVRALRS
jgi:UPF0271 protein